MEVTKQKMRCAAAEDPSYPCKHHGEEQVSQLPGEEVTTACWGVSPLITTGTSPGWSQTWGSHGRVRGQMVGPPLPRQQLPQVWRAGQLAGQCVWPGLCSQLPCHYVPAQPWLTEQKSGPCSAPVGNRVRGVPGSTQLHVYMYPAHDPRGGGLFPKYHHPGHLSQGAHPSLTCLHGSKLRHQRTLHSPWGLSQSTRELPWRGLLLPREVRPGQTWSWGLPEQTLSAAGLLPETLQISNPKHWAKGPHTRTKCGAQQDAEGIEGCRAHGKLRVGCHQGKLSSSPLMGPTCCLCRSWSLPV